MTNVPNLWRPCAGVQRAFLAARVVAQRRLIAAAEYLERSCIPVHGVLYQSCSFLHCGQRQYVQLVWPGFLQLFADGKVQQSVHMPDAHEAMPMQLSMLRRVCPADKVIFQATMRAMHTPPVLVQMDAACVLHVLHARIRKPLAMSMPGEPFLLSPEFKAVSFHDLIPTQR